MGLNSDLIKEFQTITRYDLQEYLVQFEILVKDHFNQIIQFYNGRQKVIPGESLTLLDNMLSQSKSLDYIITLNVNRMNRTDFWDLLEILEDVKTKLETMDNTARWARASVVLAKRVTNPLLSVKLGQKQTIENLAITELGSVNQHQDWYNIAITNDLREEGYTSEGGTPLQVESLGGTSFQILSIVDTMDREKMKGKDIAKMMTWENDDLKVLTGDASFIQDVSILFELRKGDNPEFVQHGLTPELAVGQNFNSIAFPILVRQIGELMRTDDAIASYSIDTLERVEDGLFIELEIISKSYEEFKINSVF